MYSIFSVLIQKNWEKICRAVTKWLFLGSKTVFFSHLWIFQNFYSDQVFFLIKQKLFWKALTIYKGSNQYIIT